MATPKGDPQLPEGRLTAACRKPILRKHQRMDTVTPTMPSRSFLSDS